MLRLAVPLLLLAPAVMLKISWQDKSADAARNRRRSSGLPQRTCRCASSRRTSICRKMIMSSGARFWSGIGNESMIDTRDWSALTLGERIRQIEVDGYVVLPDLLSARQIAQLKTETARLETIAVDYSVHQRVRSHLEFLGGAITDLIAHPVTLEFLRALFGDEIVFMT